MLSRLKAVDFYKKLPRLVLGGRGIAEGRSALFVVHRKGGNR